MFYFCCWVCVGFLVFGAFLMSWGAVERDERHPDRGFIIQILASILWFVAILLAGAAAYIQP